MDQQHPRGSIRLGRWLGGAPVGPAAVGGDHDRVRGHDSIPHANGFQSMPIRYSKGERLRSDDGAFPVFSAPRILPV